MRAAPISLYLDLEKGKHPDLEVVARAALAFSRAIKETARSVDPFSEVKVEFASSGEGSLWINSVVKFFKEDVFTKQTAIGVVIAVMASMVTGVKDAAFTKLVEIIYHQVFPEDKTGLSEEDLKKIREIYEAAQRNQPAAAATRALYVEVEKDTAITGVGASPSPEIEPEIIIPRSEFRRLSSQAQPTEEEIERRTTPTRQTLTVIKPVLLVGDRHWQFSVDGVTFGAPVRDQEFLERLLSGNLMIPMVTGVEMDVEMDVIEEKIDGVWQIRSRAITKVHRVGAPAVRQESLFPRSSPRD